MKDAVFKLSEEFIPVSLWMSREMNSVNACVIQRHSRNECRRAKQKQWCILRCRQVYVPIEKYLRAFIYDYNPKVDIKFGLNKA